MIWETKRNQIFFFQKILFKIILIIARIMQIARLQTEKKSILRLFFNLNVYSTNSDFNELITQETL